MGRASRTKAARRNAEIRSHGYGQGWYESVEKTNTPDAGTWLRIGVCKACGRTGQVTTAEGMCAPAPPGFKDDRADSCLAIVERRKTRAAR